MPTSDRRPCRECAKPTKMDGGVCRECLGPQAKRPERPCLGCQKRTTSKSQRCLTCEPTWAKPTKVTHKHAVWVDNGPGEWVNVRGVMRYVPRKPRTRAA